MKPFPRASWFSICLFLLGSASGLRAQVPGLPGPDPMEEIKEIFQQVSRWMDEIDQLLLSPEPGNKTLSGAESRMAETTELLRKLLEQAEGKQQSVIDGIQKILDKVPERNGQSQQPQDKKNDKDRKRQPQQQGDPREQDNPDFVDQQHQQQQQQDRDQQDPKGNRDSKATPKQEKGNNPPESPTGVAERDQDVRTWGDLPEYVRKAMDRKGGPPIPAKYQRFFEEYVRRAAKGKQ